MDTEVSSLQARARVHAALGDPVRLAIVDGLALSDASPGDIARDLDLPTNLMAHHVNVLDEAGLVERVRSEGDRRRTYLRLVPATLDLLISSRLATPARVVFVCTHNSARSQLAAALWRERTGRPVASAGTHPAAAVHPRTLTIARRHRLSLSPTGTSHIDQILGAGDLVIAVCDTAFEELAATRRPELHWSIPDPVRVNNDAAFETAYTQLAGRIDRLAPAIGN